MFKTENNEAVQKVTNFSLKRKPLASSYGNLRGSLTSVRRNEYKENLLDITSFTNGGQLDKYFKKPNERRNLIDCIKLSNTLYDTNPIYAKIINYYVYMYYYRNLVTPRKIKSGKIQKKYDEIYKEMLEFVEGMNIETTYAKILLEMFKNGRVYLYAKGDSKSKTVYTILLPLAYCRPTITTQYGTQQIEFDFSFFDSFGLTDDEKKDLLNLFSDEFVLGYAKYCVDKVNNKWQPLNYKFATCLSLNEDGFPTLLNTFYDIIDYKTYKLNELDKNTNYLERLVVQEIDMEKTQLDISEVQELHDSMADIICQNRGSTLVTTVGKIDVKQLQEYSSVQTDTLQNSYKSIYDNAGINNNLFVGENADALNVSLRRDEAYVWGFIEQITNFYNVAINNIKNFGNYQLSLKILPITVYNEDAKLECLHQSATLGVGVLDYVVGTGTKQVDLEASLELEEFLDLSNRLVPLQSSHTQSSTVSDTKKDGDDSKDPNKEEVPEKEIDESSSKEDSKDEDENKNSKEEE